ncbi:DUF190 domain-containing protein [Skermania sp. ID1734]|uniref:DUF190 domain-containing protein n=1 Tax=Skermania sp. ID1734 TaxID=2597516 RepID=UPI00117D3B5E|nr:DUF190 domain-containing protein [Skermania sp. ID1734]TSD94243.1 DUF190 domain-containing protein [Skermania sp. ID1734]
MNAPNLDFDSLKLTTYFGERQRVENQFLADRLLGLYAQREIATSVMLRGIGGFGIRHHLRSDQTLSLSEDPPVAVVAVDAKAKIDVLLPHVLDLKRRGLLTLERSRRVVDTAGIRLPEELNEAAKLTIYVGRQQRSSGTPAFRAVCDLLYRRGLDGASVFLGVDGTVGGRRQRARFFDRNTDVPMMIIAVGDGPKISRVVPELSALVDDAVMTLERVRVCKRDGQLFERPHALPGVDEHGLSLWQKLMVVTSESALYDGEPIHRALLRKLRESDHARGATVLRGMWGFHGDHRPHGDKLFQLARRVPTMTVIVDTPENIARSFDVADEVTREQGLVTSEMVPAALTRDGDTDHGGTRLARHDY